MCTGFGFQSFEFVGCDAELEAVFRKALNPAVGRVKELVIKAMQLVISTT